jgi:hypothetical protein
MADEQPAPADGEQKEEKPAEEPEPQKLVYKPNPKHSEPWQSGRRGSLCEASVRPRAAELLDGSVPYGDKRYAFYDGKAYCAQEEATNLWHGYPVGWEEVPPKLVRQWVKAGLVTNHDRKKYWESH